MSLDWTEDDGREEDERLNARTPWDWAYWDRIYREWCAQPFGERKAPPPPPSDDDVMAPLRNNVSGRT